MIKNRSDLKIELAALITGQTTPESISPAAVGQLVEDIIDSMFDQIDDLLTLPPISLTKAALAVKIGATTLSDGQQVTITDRTDTFPLIVRCKGNNQIHPFATWVKSGTPLAVIIDYVAGSDGETNPFIAVFDENDKLNLSQQIIIADGSQGVDKVLVSDANGKSSWKVAASFQGGVLNPANVATSGSQKMAGLAGAITPTKSGKVLIVISGEMISDDIATDTNMAIRTDSSATPANGDAASGVQQMYKALRASSATLRIPFSMQVIVSLTVGTLYWIDMGISNNGTGNVQLFNTSISAIEQ